MSPVEPLRALAASWLASADEFEQQAEGLRGLRGMPTLVAWKVATGLAYRDCASALTNALDAGPAPACGHDEGLCRALDRIKAEHEKHYRDGPGAAMTLRQRLEDALADVIERERIGIAFSAAAEDVCVAYGLSPEDIEEFAEEQQRAEVAIALEEGADR